MSVLLDPPSQLFFERPLTVTASETLTLTNTETTPLAFKVKTTSPKQYCVRPNSGRIEPGEKVQVQILLQPFKEEPADDFKCKDKFLVQSIPIPPEKVDLPIGQLWSSLEGENKGQIKERKLRCVFLPPGASNKDGSANELSSSPVLTSQLPSYSSVRDTLKHQPSDLNVGFNTAHSTSSQATGQNDNVTTLKEELKQAHTSLAQLKQELSTAQANLKAAEAKSSSTAPSSQRVATLPPGADLNVQLLGGVALVAFLLGCWLF